MIASCGYVHAYHFDLSYWLAEQYSGLMERRAGCLCAAFYGGLAATRCPTRWFRAGDSDLVASDRYDTIRIRFNRLIVWLLLCRTSSARLWALDNCIGRTGNHWAGWAITV